MASALRGGIEIMENEILLQLLVFEHATGDVTVQTEVGRLRLSANVCLKAGECESRKNWNPREAIDKAVAEQYGQRPEPPYIEQKGGLYYLHYQLQGVDHAAGMSPTVYNALSVISENRLPVVDASESQPVSTWVKAFPPESPQEFRAVIGREYQQGYTDIIHEMQKETAFTVWRLTVTR